MFRLQPALRLLSSSVKNSHSIRQLHSSPSPASVFSAFSNLFNANKPTLSKPEEDEHRYYKQVSPEEHHASPEETQTLKHIEAQLLKADELSEEAANMRQQRREILWTIGDRVERNQAEQDRLANYMRERETYKGHPKAGPDSGIVLYFFRHIQNGKIFVSETQFMDEKQFHHQLGLKKFEAVIHYRPDHWEPLLAVTGLPCRRDVQRLKEYVLDPTMQEIPRARRPLREKKGIKPHPVKKQARENLQYSKKSVTRLNHGLAELQKDCNDLKDVKILWSRPMERNILLRLGVEPEELEKPGVWVPFVKHDEMKVDGGRKITSISEDISWRVEKRVRHRLMKPMPAHGQPWYPLLKPGRGQWLAEQKRITGKSKVIC